MSPPVKDKKSNSGKDKEKRKKSPEKQPVKPRRTSRVLSPASEAVSPASAQQGKTPSVKNSSEYGKDAATKKNQGKSPAKTPVKTRAPASEAAIPPPASAQQDKSHPSCSWMSSDSPTHSPGAFSGMRDSPYSTPSTGVTQPPPRDRPVTRGKILEVKRFLDSNPNSRTSVVQGIHACSFLSFQELQRHLASEVTQETFNNLHNIVLELDTENFLHLFSQTYITLGASALLCAHEDRDTGDGDTPDFRKDRETNCLIISHAMKKKIPVCIHDKGYCDVETCKNILRKSLSPYLMENFRAVVNVFEEENILEKENELKFRLRQHDDALNFITANPCQGFRSRGGVGI